MPVEIERKFLVNSDGWLRQVQSSHKLQDGLVAAVAGRKVRIRITDGFASLTVKGKRSGLARDEFEYPIPLTDAEHMLAHHCEGRVIFKTRYVVIEDGFKFEVDVYNGLLEGIVIAEAELSSVDQDFPRPAWLGEEVTGKEEYRKINLLNVRLGTTAEKQLSAPDLAKATYT